MGKGIGIQLNDNASNNVEIMDFKIDVVRDASGKIEKGITIGATLQQNKALILITQPGEFKFRPDLGVGIEDLLLNSNYLEYRHRIREQFAKDGLKTTRVDLYESRPIEIEANYES